MKRKIIIICGGLCFLVVTGILFWLFIHYNHSKKNANAPEVIKIRCEYGTVRSYGSTQMVSLINLIATPEKYHGKWIQAKGVANFEFEGNALFFSKADFKFVTKNALWLSPNITALKVDESTLAKELNGQQVLVEGIFDMNDHGHMGLFSGAIQNVSRIMTWEQR